MLVFCFQLDTVNTTMDKHSSVLNVIAPALIAEGYMI